MHDISTNRLYIFSLVLMLSGCKLGVIVPIGGDVDALSGGTADCFSGSYCQRSIARQNFSDTYVAIPKPGYEFVKWHDGSGFWCAGSTDPSCTVTFNNSLIPQAILDSFEVAYIMPIFRDIGFDPDGDGVRNELDDDDDNDGILDVDDVCPMNPDTSCGNGPDILTIGSKQWYQPVLFQASSWNEVNQVCPSGVCSGYLYGYDLTGWTWANRQDLAALFYSYVGTSWFYPPVSSGRIYYDDDGVESVWATAFFDDGWRPSSFSSSSSRSVHGWQSEHDCYQINSTDRACRAGLTDYLHSCRDGIPCAPDVALLNHGTEDPTGGAWFYRQLP